MSQPPNDQQQPQGQDPYQPPYGQQFPPPQYPPPYTGQHSAPESKSWFLRHKIIGVLIGGVGVLVVIGAIGSAAGMGKTAVKAGRPATVQARQAVVKHEPAAVRHGTPVPGQAPSPSLMPSQAPAPSAAVVATFRGSGTGNTPRFTVGATWKLEYSYDCSAYGGRGNFIVSEDGGSNFGGASVNELGSRGSSSTWAYNDAGTHYLSVDSECSWTMRVVDEG